MLDRQLRNFNANFTLSNCLLVSVKLTKNADLDKYNYTGYGIGFDSCEEYFLSDDSVGRNVIISGIYMI